MEKLTITRVGEVKEVTTKFGPKKKQGVQFKEYGDIWHDVWTSGLKVGDILEGTRESREWEGKTYWSFKLPKKDDAVNEKLEKILNEITKLKMTMQIMVDLNQSKFNKVVSQAEDKARGYHYDTPQEAGMVDEPIEHEINLDDVPF